MGKGLNNSPSSNTAAVLTLTKIDTGFGKQEILGVSWSYDGAPTAGNLKVESPAGTVLQSWDITAAGPGFIITPDLHGGDGADMIITLAAGGSGVTGKVNCVQRGSG